MAKSAHFLTHSLTHFTTPLAKLPHFNNTTGSITMSGFSHKKSTTSDHTLWIVCNGFSSLAFSIESWATVFNHSGNADNISHMLLGLVIQFTTNAVMSLATAGMLRKDLPNTSNAPTNHHSNGHHSPPNNLSDSTGILSFPDNTHHKLASLMLSTLSDRWTASPTIKSHLIFSPCIIEWSLSVSSPLLKISKCSLKKSFPFLAIYSSTSWLSVTHSGMSLDALILSAMYALLLLNSTNAFPVGVSWSYSFWLTFSWNLDDCGPGLDFIASWYHGDCSVVLIACCCTPAICHGLLIPPMFGHKFLGITDGCFGLACGFSFNQREMYHSAGQSAVLIIGCDTLLIIGFGSNFGFFWSVGSNPQYLGVNPYPIAILVFGYI